MGESPSSRGFLGQGPADVHPWTGSSTAAIEDSFPPNTVQQPLSLAGHPTNICHSQTHSPLVTEKTFLEKDRCDGCGEVIPKPRFLYRAKTKDFFPMGRSHGDMKHGEKDTFLGLTFWCHSRDPCWNRCRQKVTAILADETLAPHTPHSSEPSDVVKPAHPGIGSSQTSKSLAVSSTQPEIESERHVLFPCDDCGSAIHWGMNTSRTNEKGVRTRRRGPKPSNDRRMTCSGGRCVERPQILLIHPRELQPKHGEWRGDSAGFVAEDLSFGS